MPFIALLSRFYWFHLFPMHLHDRPEDIQDRRVSENQRKPAILAGSNRRFRNGRDGRSPCGLFEGSGPGRQLHRRGNRLGRRRGHGRRPRVHGCPFFPRQTPDGKRSFYREISLEGRRSFPPALPGRGRRFSGFRGDSRRLQTSQGRPLRKKKSAWPPSRRPSSRPPASPWKTPKPARKFSSLTRKLHRRFNRKRRLGPGMRRLSGSGGSFRMSGQRGDQPPLPKRRPGGYGVICAGSRR